MKSKLKELFVRMRNRWGFSNSIKRSNGGRITIFGNLLKTSIVVNGNSNVKIGKDCLLRNGTINVKGNSNVVVLQEGVFFSGSIELFGDSNTIYIGNNTRINGADFIVHNGTKVEIGANCLFSTKIDVRTTDSHSIYNSEGLRINPDKNIYIGNNVWIGRLVSILKGSVIGSGVVIGSSSVVCGKITDNVVAVGVPAKAIKNNISWKE